jgi:hypothetical protein
VGAIGSRRLGRSTPIVGATDLAATDPTERLHHHIGVAIQRLWPTSSAVE